MTLTEFRTAMGLLGIGKGNNALVELLFRAIAPKDEMVITQKEYVAALRTLIAGTPEDKIRFGFTLLDKNNSNKVTGDDIKGILSILYRSYNTLLGYNTGSGHDENRREVSVEDVEEVVKRFDTDHNGDIQFSEWMLGIQRHQDIFTHLAHIVDPEQALKKWNEVSSLVGHLETMLVRSFEDKEKRSLDTDSKNTFRNSSQVASRLFRETNKRRAQSKDAAKDDDDSPPLPPSKPKIAAPTAPFPLPGLKPKKGRKSSSSSSSSIGTREQEILKQLRYIRNTLDEMRADMDYLQPVSVLPQTLTERRRVMNKRKAVAVHAALVASQKKLLGENSDFNILDSPTKDEEIKVEDDDNKPKKIKEEKEEEEEEEEETATNEARSAIGDVRSLLSERIAASARGTVVTFGHEFWNTTLSIMQGIHLAATRATSEGNRPLSSHDFYVRDKYVLRPESIDPELKKTDHRNRAWRNPIKFYDFAPRAFHVLRTTWNIAARDYITSCGPGKILSNLIIGSLTAISRSQSEGKSGDFFYTTGDSRYMMKTISQTEYKTFRDMIPEYVQHMTVENLDADPPTPGVNSLICKFCGLHKMKTQIGNSVTKVYFVVMLNCNPPDDVIPIHRRFDLKGSYKGRTAIKKSKDLMSLRQLPLNESFDKILKDNDFDKLKNSIGDIRLGDEKKLLFTNTMRADVRFLERHEIMDYSLIVSIHFKTDSYVLSLSFSLFSVGA